MANASSSTLAVLALPTVIIQADGQFRADPWAEYAILTVENGETSLEFRRIPFDVEKLIQIYNESGRPFADEAIAQYQ